MRLTGTVPMLWGITLQNRPQQASLAQSDQAHRSLSSWSEDKASFSQVQKSLLRFAADPLPTVKKENLCFIDTKAEAFIYVTAGIKSPLYLAKPGGNCVALHIKTEEGYSLPTGRTPPGTILYTTLGGPGNDRYKELGLMPEL